MRIDLKLGDDAVGTSSTSDRLQKREQVSMNCVSRAPCLCIRASVRDSPHPEEIRVCRSGRDVPDLPVCSDDLDAAELIHNETPAAAEEAEPAVAAVPADADKWADASCKSPTLGVQSQPNIA